jgi:nucleotide-binding universal stress UspA family protein
MKKILVAVDGSRDSEKAVEKSAEISKCFGSEIVLVYVQKFPGNIFSDPEMKELRKSLESSAVKKELESRDKAILRDAESILRKNSVGKVKTLIRWGHPAEEILKLTEELWVLLRCSRDGKHGEPKEKCNERPSSPRS